MSLLAEEADAAVAEAGVEAAEVVAHAAAEVFPIRAEPHVRVDRAQAVARVRVAGRAQAVDRVRAAGQAQAAGRVRVVSRPPRDRLEVAQLPRRAAPHRVLLPDLANGQGPAVGRRIALPEAVQRLAI
jgi:hypothetical protein